MMFLGVGAGGWLWMLAGLDLVVGIILIVAWAIGRGGGGPGDEAMELLRTRFARGEIDAARFEQQWRLLETGSGWHASDRVGLIGLLLVVAAIVFWLVGSALGPAGWNPGWGPMTGPGMMSGAWTTDQNGPGSQGFPAGTAAAPRLVQISDICNRR